MASSSSSSSSNASWSRPGVVGFVEAVVVASEEIMQWVADPFRGCRGRPYHDNAAAADDDGTGSGNCTEKEHQQEEQQQHHLLSRTPPVTPPLTPQSHISDHNDHDSKVPSQSRRGILRKDGSFFDFIIDSTNSAGSGGSDSDYAAARAAARASARAAARAARAAARTARASLSKEARAREGATTTTTTQGDARGAGVVRWAPDVDVREKWLTMLVETNERPRARAMAIDGEHPFMWEGVPDFIGADFSPESLIFDSDSDSDLDSSNSDSDSDSGSGSGSGSGSDSGSKPVREPESVPEPDIVEAGAGAEAEAEAEPESAPERGIVRQYAIEFAPERVLVRQHAMRQSSLGSLCYSVVESAAPPAGFLSRAALFAAENLSGNNLSGNNLSGINLRGNLSGNGNGNDIPNGTNLSGIGSGNLYGNILSGTGDNNLRFTLGRILSGNLTSGESNNGVRNDDESDARRSPANWLAAAGLIDTLDGTAGRKGNGSLLHREITASTMCSGSSISSIGSDGAAAAATWMFRGESCWDGWGCGVDIVVLGTEERCGDGEGGVEEEEEEGGNSGFAARLLDLAKVEGRSSLLFKRAYFNSEG